MVGLSLPSVMSWHNCMQCRAADHRQQLQGEATILIRIQPRPEVRTACTPVLPQKQCGPNHPTLQMQHLHTAEAFVSKKQAAAHTATSTVPAMMRLVPHTICDGLDTGCTEYTKQAQHDRVPDSLQLILLLAPVNAVAVGQDNHRIAAYLLQALVCLMLQHSDRVFWAPAQFARHCVPCHKVHQGGHAQQCAPPADTSQGRHVSLSHHSVSAHHQYRLHCLHSSLALKATGVARPPCKVSGCKGTCMSICLQPCLLSHPSL